MQEPKPELSPNPSQSNPRFVGCEQLLGSGYNQLVNAHVAVIGLGGVGSWAAEALIRSGVGRLTIIDPDEVCINNANRQLHALDSSIGRPKVEVLAERFRAINPYCQVDAQQIWLTPENTYEILVEDGRPRFDGVIDAIDTVAPKCTLIRGCNDLRIPMVVCGGASGKVNPNRIRIIDLNRTCNDPLLAKVRKVLRQNHGWARGVEDFGIASVSSTEKAKTPEIQACEATSPFDAMMGTGRASCENGYGSVCFITGTMGFHAASVIVRMIVEENYVH